MTYIYIYKRYRIFDASCIVKYKEKDRFPYSTCSKYIFFNRQALNTHIRIGYYPYDPKHTIQLEHHVANLVQQYNLQ